MEGLGFALPEEARVLIFAYEIKELFERGYFRRRRV